MKNLSLTQTVQFIKSQWLLIVLAAGSIILVSLSLISSFRTKAPEAPQSASWQQNIYAGQTTKAEVESKLGPPIKTEEKDGKTIYSYQSINQYRPHQIELLGEKVVTIKEQVIKDEKGKLNDYIQKYGPPEAEIFGTHGTTSPGHFWGKIGLLVYAGNFDGTIIEIWYFQPTTLEKFLLDNPNFTTEEPIEGF